MMELARVCGVVLIFGLSSFFVECARFLLPNVPYHRQITDYACGDASTHMVLHSFGANIDQRAIIDVLRTTSNYGTFSLDVVRGGHFSVYSKSQYAGPFPAQAPQHGWSQVRALGLSTFGFRSTSCWLTELKTSISQGYPAIVLMNYAVNQSDGHFRVAVGFDDEKQLVAVYDPWDRPNSLKGLDAGGNQPRLIYYSNADFCKMWSRREPYLNGTTLDPYFAVLMKPWQVNFAYYVNEHNTVTVDAEITYPFPPITSIKPLATFPASYSMAELQVPKGWTLSSNNTVLLGVMQPGQTVKVSWDVEPPLEDPNEEIRDITVSSYGIIHGSLPPIFGPNSTIYPAYDYTDVIGGWQSVII
jgi:hypothetical protein